MKHARIAGWLLAFFLLAIDAVVQVKAGNSGDKNWLLLTTEMWFQGKKLYVDLVNPNLPLIFCLYAIPVWVSSHFPVLADYHALAILGFGCTIISIGLCLFLIRKHPAFTGDTRRQSEFSLLLAYVFVFFVPPSFFFDREHIFLVLTFPYMLRFMPSLARQPISLRLRLVIGGLAAVGFCMKPHTIILFAAIEGFYLMRERSPGILWSIENGVIYTGTLLYLFCIWHLTPGYVDVVLPILLLTYAACGRQAMGLVYSFIAMLFASLTFVDFRPRYVTPYRKDVYYFSGICLAFFAYALLNSGWRYTYMPLLCMLLFLSCWVFWEYGWLRREHESQGLSTRQFIFGQRSCALNIVFAIAYIIYSVLLVPRNPECPEAAACQVDTRLARFLSDNHIHSFGAVSMDFNRWTVVARMSEAQWDTRFNELWMLPKLIKEGPVYTATHQWVVDYVGRAYAQDFNRRQPEVVFVDNSPGFYLYYPHVDLLAFFGVVPEFKEAWRLYRYTTTIDTCVPGSLRRPLLPSECKYAIYLRTPER